MEVKEGRRVSTVANLGTLPESANSPREEVKEVKVVSLAHGGVIPPRELVSGGPTLVAKGASTPGRVKASMRFPRRQLVLLLTAEQRHQPTAARPRRLHGLSVIPSGLLRP